jgi:hypothetical protein
VAERAFRNSTCTPPVLNPGPSMWSQGPQKVLYSSITHLGKVFFGSWQIIYITRMEAWRDIRQHSINPKRILHLPKRILHLETKMITIWTIENFFFFFWYLFNVQSNGISPLLELLASTSNQCSFLDAHHP